MTLAPFTYLLEINLKYDLKNLKKMISKALALSVRAGFIPSESLPGDSQYRVCPPTYAIDQKYLITERGEVRLDSPQSFANRLEARIMREGITPSIDVIDQVGAVIVNSRQLPHRVFDAALRDSLLDGQPFFKSPLGASLRAARPKTATALFKHSPETLLFGAWDSHMGGGSQVARWPRAITGRVFGTGATRRQGAASKGDPLGFDNDALGAVYITLEGTMTLDESQAATDEKGKKRTWKKLSGSGHGQIITTEGAVDGVDVNDIYLQAAVHLGQLRAYAFPTEVSSVEQDIAARMVLTALGVWAVQATITDSFTLRSGCDLICESLAWTARWGLGKDEPLEITAEEARAVLKETISILEGISLGWDITPIPLQASPSLLQALTLSAVA